MGMEALGDLIGAFIWIGLFFGLLMFIASSVALVLFMIELSIRIEDRIKAKRCERCKYGVGGYCTYYGPRIKETKCPLKEKK